MPARKLLIPGSRFTRLLVIRDLGTRNRRSWSLVRCDCGKEVEVQNQYLLCGDTRSCGCLKLEIIAARGRIQGPITGRMMVESGQLARIHQLPQSKAVYREAGLKFGPIYGRKNVENGHLDRIRQLPQAKAAQRKNGLELGRKAVESGHLDRIRQLPQSKEALRKSAIRLNSDSRRSEWSKRGGRISGPYSGFPKKELSSLGGQKRVESGNLGYGIQCITEDGILVKSMDEAIFWSVFGGKRNVEYEPEHIRLSSGLSYTYDFRLKKSRHGIPANIPIELKPTNHPWVDHTTKKAKEIGALIVYANELWES